MPFFKYKAVSTAGQVQEGVLEAASSAAAVARVQAMGLIPIRADEATTAPITPEVPTKNSAGPSSSAAP